jgi:hypothetical protein
MVMMRYFEVMLGQTVNSSVGPIEVCNFVQCQIFVNYLTFAFD